MKTNLLFLSLFFLLLNSNIGHSQTIPNSDFENWESTPWFSYDPVSWTTDNSGVAAARVAPDSLAYSNLLAMRVIARPAELGMHGEASIVIPNTGSAPEQLSFYAKWEKTSTAYVTVQVTFTTAENDQIYFSWAPTENQSAWTPINLELPLEGPDLPLITDVTIQVISTVGDFAPGEGWIAVDDKNMSTTTAIENINESSNLSIYPNPSQNEIQVSFDSSMINSNYQIIDLQGRIVQQGKITETLNIENLSNGHYILQALNRENLIQEKFIVKK